MKLASLTLEQLEIRDLKARIVKLQSTTHLSVGDREKLVELQTIAHKEPSFPRMVRARQLVAEVLSSAGAAK